MYRRLRGEKKKCEVATQSFASLKDREVSTVQVTFTSDFPGFLPKLLLVHTLVEWGCSQVPHKMSP